jgi:sugar lactone lactonase YvrE
MTSENLMKPFLQGLAFPEGPRWHDGALWFSDFYTHRVVRATMDGRSETVVEVPGQPSGLGWLPDGRLLVVSMTDRKLMRLDPQGLVEVADLSRLAPFHCNDMVVDAQGRAYVGNFGFDLGGGQPERPTSLILVEPDGRSRIVADDLHFPNGTVITPDGKTLIIGESFAARLSAFDIAPDGSLGRRRVWAQLKGAVPDGICLDAEGAIWVASPVSHEVLRVREGGEVTQRTAVGAQAVACMLGGPGRRTLFILSGKVRTTPEQSRARLGGMILSMPVEVAGVGWP